VAVLSGGEGGRGKRDEIAPRRVLLIANPVARRAGPALRAALGAFREAGVQADSMLTEYAGHAAELAVRLAGEYDAVFTLGGDGTAMEVVGALAGSPTPVGLLPGGTGNLIARSLGVPLGVRAAVRALLAGDRARIDLGRLDDGRRFAFTVGVGIDARMIEETPATLKRRLGVLAYGLAASRALIRRQTFRVRVEVDGEVLERDASAVFVANFGAVLNDLFRFGPGIRYDDGLLDVCVFSPRTLRDTARIMFRLFRKDFRSDDCVLYRPGREIRIETRPPRRVQADGELLGPTPFAVTVEPLAASLLMPRRA
jgi:diacylglycerol kinase (ATP)